MEPVELHKLAEVTHGSVIGDATTRVHHVTQDSRTVRPGSLFVARRGANFDGTAFIEQAVRDGAVALAVEAAVTADVAQLVCPDLQQNIGPIAHFVAGNPSERMCVIGVTGTNGKTSVVTLIAALLRRLGKRVEVIGTLTGVRTTPEGTDLALQLREFAEREVEFVAMEVSSHAIELGRVNGVHFEVVAFTNLGIDHLDFHGSQQNYFESKAALFDPRFANAALINVDDVFGRQLAERTSLPHHDIALGLVQPYAVVDGETDLTWRGHRIRTPLVGEHNLSNLCMALELVATVLDDEAAIADAAQQISGAPGRFEAVSLGQPFSVIVDYAHTPDGLESVLSTARKLAGDHRVITVFGCGGDRDRSKRPLMGAIASRLSDLVIVTNDNPRSESPEAIAKSVVGGIERDNFRVHLDRLVAIRVALENSLSGDVVMICGKGHETSQIIGDDVVPFDDRVVAAEALGVLGFSKEPS